MNLSRVRLFVCSLATAIALASTVTAVPEPAVAAVTPTGPPVALASPPGANAYTLLDSNGCVYNFGTAYLGGCPTQGVALPFVSMAYTPSGNGYALLDSAGHVYNYGDSTYQGGSPQGAALPFRAIAYQPGSYGYTLMDSDGHIYNYGTAYHGGSPAGATTPFKGFVYTPSGNGYTLMDAVGHIYNYGDSQYHGGNPTGATTPMAPLASPPGSYGYTQLDAVGHIYNYGTAYLGGFPAGSSPPFIGIVYTPTGNGYTLADGVGHIYNYGDSIYRGGFDQPAPTDTRKKLAREILGNGRINKSGRLVTRDLELASEGRPSTAGKLLSTTMLQILANLGVDHTFTISALESGGTGHSPRSVHYDGRAVDISVFDGVVVTGRNAPALTMIQLIAPQLPSGSGFGQSNCLAPRRPAPPLPPGITTFEDTCNHLHISLNRAAP